MRGSATVVGCAVRCSASSNSENTVCHAAELDTPYGYSYESFRYIMPSSTCLKPSLAYIARAGAVLLHRLGFDQQNAAVAESFEGLAEQKRREAFAALIRGHAQIEHASGRSAPGGGKGFDVPEPHVGHRLAAAGRVSRKRIRSNAPVVHASHHDCDGGEGFPGKPFRGGADVGCE